MQTPTSLNYVRSTERSTGRLPAPTAGMISIWTTDSMRRGKAIRYTVGPAARQEILDRLLGLNHERYAAEVAAGLHDRKARRRGAGEQGELFS